MFAPRPRTVLLLIGFLACLSMSAAAFAQDDVTRIVLIGNQRFGDAGPMDAMAAGLERCEADFGFETRTLESPTPAEHEENVRAMAREGYDLVMTTFPPMTDATLTVAEEYPDTLFAAIYQFVNVGGNSVPNVWDTDYQGQQATFLLGVIAGSLTETQRLGYIQGDSSEPIVNERNGFIAGVKQVCPNCEVEFASTESFEDPAQGKEVALAMYSRGVDVIETGAALTQLGAIEAAVETGNLIIGDVGDNYEMYPEGFVGYLGVDFGANVYLACQMLAEGNFLGGQQTHMDVTNGGYYVPWDALERFAEDNEAYRDRLLEAIEYARELEQQIIDGTLIIGYDPSQVPPEEPMVTVVEEAAATEEMEAAEESGS